MKSEELRIGNYLYFKNTVDLAIVELIHKKHFDCRDELGIFTPNGNYEPIPLTEEWLKKFGFDWHEGWLIIDAFSPGHPSQRFDLYWNDIDGFMTKSRYQQDNHGFKMRHIQNVHQLQNLYHALTGVELQLK